MNIASFVNLRSFTPRARVLRGCRFTRNSFTPHYRFAPTSPTLAAATTTCNTPA